MKVELNPLDRLIRILEVERDSPGTPNNIKEALVEILQKIGEERVKVRIPEEITNVLVCGEVGDFSYFRCPNCGYIAKQPGYCPKCRRPLIHAYVGVPVDFGGATSPYKVRQCRENADSMLILPVAKIRNIYCPIVRQSKGRWREGNEGLKGLASLSRKRPLQSLAFVCPYDDIECKYREPGNPPRCLHGAEENQRIQIFFPPLGGIKRVPALPSEGFTKPYTKTIFSEVELKKIVNLSQFHVARFGRFRIWTITMFYLVGSNYTPRRNRRPSFEEDSEGNLVFSGRSMETEGLLLVLDWDKVKEVVNRVKNYRVLADEYTVAHSVAHVALKAVVQLTGLSFTEFGEAVYVDKQNGVAEVLIYDDAPGGIGGVKAVVDAERDFKDYLLLNSERCPRSCRQACRACLYVENCNSLNFNLSWLAAYYYMR